MNKTFLAIIGNVGLISLVLGLVLLMYLPDTTVNHAICEVLTFVGGIGMCFPLAWLIYKVINKENEQND